MSDFNSSNDRRHGIAMLRRAGRLAIALGALTTTIAFANPRLGTIEECVETGTTLVTLPGLPGGTLSAKSCSSCATLRLSFDANTRFFIGKTAVSYARLQSEAAKGPAALYVFYRPDTRVLSRVRLDPGAGANNL